MAGPYYVDDTTGLDSDTGLSEALAFKTVDKAMTVIAAGEKCYVKGGATYSETPVVITAGTSASPTIFEGYTDTPGDNGKATITGTTNCMTSALGSMYYIFKNLIFSGASSIGVSASSADDIIWINCEFNNNGNRGVFVDNSNQFVNCIAHNNGDFGMDSDASCSFIGNILYANGTSHQLNTDQAILFYKNVIYGGGIGDRAISMISANAVIGNTLDGENAATSTGVYAIAETNCHIIDNIIYDFVTGVDAGNWVQTQGFVGYNLMNSNSTADYDFSGDVIGYQDVTTAPAFTNEDGDDYTLGVTSPAIDAGLQPGGIT